jgi:glucosyl-3-phosphoglycerate phosphatase
MKRLILVRHGETEWNAREILQGQADIELSDNGRKQALALAAMLGRWQIDVAVTSDLKRTRQTSELLGYAHARADALWREADLGLWTGSDAKELKATSGDEYRAWREGRAAPPKGESFDALSRRIAAAIAPLHAAGDTVLVVTHGGVVRAALAQLIGLTPERIVPVLPGSLTVLAFDAAPRLELYNVTARLLGGESTE